MTEDIKKLRRSLVWAVPYLLVLVVVAILVIYFVIAPEIRNFYASAPSVRVSSSWLIVPFTALLLMSAIVLLLSKAFAGAVAVHWSKTVTVIFMVMQIATVIAALPLGNFVYPHFLGKSGYSECNILKGHPTVWFSDWVRDPTWCVKGQSRAWVAEQAAKVTKTP
jgi:Na+-driven multidrug efflux pump